MLAEQITESTSHDPPLFLLAVAAAAASIVLLLCIVILICAIVCLRRRRNNMHYRDERNLPFVLHTHDVTDYNKYSAENGYKKVNTNKLSTIKRRESMPPVPSPFLKGFKLTTVNLAELTRVKPNSHNVRIKENVCYSTINYEGTELELDIYDDIFPASEIVNGPQLTQQYLCEDIYCEAFDCNYTDDVACDDRSTTLSMCIPIYNEPTPLKREEAPKLVEWGSINVLKKIGEGEFGDVFLAEASDDVTSECTKPNTMVAIKTLKGDYSPTMKQQFKKEIKFMTRLKNPNVVQLMGICNKGTPFIMMEYMRNGDLNMFLKKHYFPEVGKDSEEAVIPVDSVILQYIGLQIANGMRYLASYGFIHRDLAARNCLVGEDYVVKIADFGMTQDLYNEAYFIMRGKAILPIRWMAPESFFGRFSSKTDVWSYGVTLWEIYTLCRMQPYHEMTDEQLITDVQKGRRVLLKQPPDTPDKVYDVMVNCWIYNPTQRPDFESLYDQLLENYKLNCKILSSHLE